MNNNNNNKTCVLGLIGPTTASRNNYLIVLILQMTTLKIQIKYRLPINDMT